MDGVCGKAQVCRSDSARAFALCPWLVSVSCQKHVGSCQCQSYLTSKYSITDVDEDHIISCTTQKVFKKKKEHLEKSDSSPVLVRLSQGPWGWCPDFLKFWLFYTSFFFKPALCEHVPLQCDRSRASLARWFSLAIKLFTSRSQYKRTTEGTHCSTVELGVGER